MKYGKNLSLSLSIVFSLVGLVAIFFTAILLPFYVEWKCTNTLSMFTGELPALAEKVFIYIDGYLLLLLALIADGVLLALLRLTRNGEIFTPKAVSLLKIIARLTVLVGALFALLTPWFKMACVVGFVIIFVGLVVKVVKNVIEEATAIKAENDFTI